MPEEPDGHPAGRVRVRLWGDARMMVEADREKLAEFIAKNAHVKPGRVELYDATPADAKVADAVSKRGGVDGGTGKDADREKPT